MNRYKIIKMEKRHVPDSALFIQEVLGEGKSVAEETLYDFLKWDEDKVLLLVAEDQDGKFAGMAGIVYERWNDTGMIEWIGLIKEARGQELGTTMLNQMTEWTAKNGGRKIYVDTGVNSSKAISFYRKNGLSKEAVLKDWYCDGSDAVLMSKRIIGTS